MEKPVETGRVRLEGLVIGLWGRHELYVISLAALLEHRGAGVRVLTDPLEDDRVDVVLLESPLPSELVRVTQAGVQAVVLEEHTGATDHAATLALGAHDALGKNASLGELVRAIDGAAADRRAASAIGLTGRQRQVLTLLADGLDNAQIAARLGISLRTARAHVSGVLERLGVDNRTKAAVTAVRKGWIG